MPLPLHPALIPSVWPICTNVISSTADLQFLSLLESGTVEVNLPSSLQYRDGLHAFLGLFSPVDRDFSLVVKSFRKTVQAAPGGGGKGGTQQSFIRGGSTLSSKPLPFYIPFLTEEVALSYTFLRKLYPFHIPTEPLFLNFSLKKALKILGQISR